MKNYNIEKSYNIQLALELERAKSYNCKCIQLYQTENNYYRNMLESTDEQECKTEEVLEYNINLGI